MAPRSSVMAPALGILLVLGVLACFGVRLWANAPMEEPASPGRTPNPSQVMSDAEYERMLRRAFWLDRFVRYGAIPGGILCLGVGVLLLLPERSRPR